MTTITRLRKELPTVLLLAAPFAMAAIVWDHLPSQIPVHWDATGSVDGWSSVKASFLLLPAVSVAVYLASLMMAYWGGKDWPRVFAKPYPPLWLGVALFLTGLLCVLNIDLLTDMAPETKRRLVFGLISVFVVFVGNYFPSLQPNYFFGIRTPWTLASKRVWRITHRQSAFVWVAAGLIVLLLVVVTAAGPSKPVMAGMAVVLLVYPVALSYVVFVRERNRAAS